MNEIVRPQVPGPIDHKRQALLQLKDRLEKATGRDRDLDADIYIAFNIPAERAGRIDKGKYGVVGWWPKDGAYVSAIDVPEYTDSIDAAVTLVPDGLRWVTGVAEEMTIGAISDGARSHECQASTPALALCKARIEYELAAHGEP